MQGYSNNSRNGVSAGDVIQAPSEIQSGMNDVEGQISMLMGRLANLHDMLGSVMSPGCPMEDSLKSIHSGPTTQLGQDLAGYRDRLNAANNSVQDILDRLKL